MQIRIQHLFMPKLFALIQRSHPQGQRDVTKHWPQSNECIKKLIHIFSCSPTINNTDISISARKASLGQTLPLAFKQTSTGTHSPRLPWGGDTPVPDHSVLLGSVSFTPAVLIAAEKEGDTEAEGRERNNTHRGAHSFPPPLLCLSRTARLGLGYSN